MLIAAVSPVLIYGFWALSRGGHFLPNSLLMKGNMAPISEIVRKTLSLFVTIPEYCSYLYLLALPLVAALSFPGVRRIWRLAALSTLVAIAGQIVLADVTPGALWRYDAYLMTLGTTVAVLALATSARRRLAWTLAQSAALLVAAVGIADRAWDVVPATVWSSEDIYSQQIQMTRIMGELPEPDRGCVAINDLGYTSLHLGLPIFDIWGLGTQDVADDRIRMKGGWSAAILADEFRRHAVRYMMVYESWYPIQGMPRDTIPVAFLDTEEPYICGGDSVAFRAFTPADAERLAQHLAKYVDRLPRRASLRIVWQSPKPLCAR